MTRLLCISLFASYVFSPAASQGDPSTSDPASATATSSSSTSSAIALSTDGHCGGTSDEQCLDSQWGDCCSANGFCGGNDVSIAAQYCGVGCQGAFGNCWNNISSITVDGSCGGSGGKSCLGSTFGDCCSEQGFCGGNSSYCGTGCKAAFGFCDSNDSSFTSGGSSVADSVGFKAGMAVLVVVVVALIGVVIFVVMRRRRKQQPKQAAAPYPAAAELGSKSVEKHELADTNARPEIPVELQGQSKYAELPADESKREKEKVRIALVDERAAKGYDGAYRGN